MELLEKTILEKGEVLDGDVLKVDSFLNHQLDVSVLYEMGKYIYEKFSDCKVDKILTVEASGIAIACLTAQFFCCPVLFAKKSRSANLGADGIYTAEVASYTHGNVNTIMVNAKYLGAGENVLIVDDFLARGEAMRGMITVCDKAGANVVGLVAAIEKGYQGGGDELRRKGYRVESLAIIDEMHGKDIKFRQ